MGFALGGMVKFVDVRGMKFVVCALELSTAADNKIQQRLTAFITIRFAGV